MHAATGLGMGCINAMIVLIGMMRMHMSRLQIELVRMRKLRTSQNKGEGGNELNQRFRRQPKQHVLSCHLQMRQKFYRCETS